MPTKIVEYGPVRAIGMSRVAKADGGDFPKLWEEFMMAAGSLPRLDGTAFGFCRCVPGKTDGTFEYVASIAVPTDAKVPAGMIEVSVPRCDYAVFDVAGLKDIGQAWQNVPKAMAALDKWDPYCGPKGCECATHPCFEMYPRTFMDDGKLALYVPVKPR